MEFFRDQAADSFERHVGSAWRPRSGSKANHRVLPIGVLHFPGAGILHNLADGARKLGIPVWKVRSGGA